MRKINNKQKQLIHIAKGQLGLSEEKYRQMLRDRYDSCWEGSCLELSYEEATDFIDHLKSLGARIKTRSKRKRRPAKKAGSIADFPSEDQWGKIYAISHDIEWRAGMKPGLRGFCKRMLGVPWPQTGEQASELIEHLKHMRRNQQRKRVRNAKA